MRWFFIRLVFPLVLLQVAGCAFIGTTPDQCLAGVEELSDCPPPEAIDDPQINEWYKLRTWLPHSQLEVDPIQLGIDAEIPIQQVRAKLIGSSDEGTLESLAAKIHMIEQAEHSIDAAYYIFSADLVGLAMLGGLCDAVRRGVDVRVMIDSIGSFSLDRIWLRALQSCGRQASYIKNRNGQFTNRRARVQAIVFNALSRVFINPNRRFHDKLLVVYGSFGDKAAVLTGGHNILLSYYGIHADGSLSADSYLDAEILLRPGDSSVGKQDIGTTAENYFTLLSVYKNNKILKASRLDHVQCSYVEKRDEFCQGLSTLKQFPLVRKHLDSMPEYFHRDFHSTDVLLAHEFGNLIDKRVITDALRNMENNPNSITCFLRQAAQRDDKHSKIVSPHLFASKHHDKQGNPLLDEAVELHK